MPVKLESVPITFCLLYMNKFCNIISENLRRIVAGIFTSFLSSAQTCLSTEVEDQNKEFNGDKILLILIYHII